MSKNCFNFIQYYATESDVGVFQIFFWNLEWLNTHVYVSKCPYLQVSS